ncbi:hypothetical protein ACQEUU_11945 [Nonomuraea sp. CA-218870]|uniref:hypothetical protein n=1 Tax=Nonomuraea sp. CA-218870 TaxID=3239998 RepID=UPI003D8A4336
MNSASEASRRDPVTPPRRGLRRLLHRGQVELAGGLPEEPEVVARHHAQHLLQAVTGQDLPADVGPLVVPARQRAGQLVAHGPDPAEKVHAVIVTLTAAFRVPVEKSFSTESRFHALS